MSEEKNFEEEVMSAEEVEPEPTEIVAEEPKGSIAASLLEAPIDPPQEEKSDDPVLKPKRKVNRSAGQIEGLKKAQEVRRKNSELRKAEKLVEAQELLHEKELEKEQKAAAKAAARAKKTVVAPDTDTSLKQLKELVQILDLTKGRKKDIPSDTDSDDEADILRMEKALARKKAIRKVLREEKLRDKPTPDRNTVNNKPKNILAFS